MTAAQMAGVRRLLAWESRFAEGAPAGGKWSSETEARNGVKTFSYPKYAVDVDAFFAAVHEEFTEYDYLQKLRALGGLQHSSEWFATASYEALRTVVFAISRGERFCGGLRLAQCENGDVRRILARLREILRFQEARGNAS